VATSPTTLSLKNMRERGYLSAVVEKWNPHAKIRQDLYGIIDLVGVGDGTLAVQSTSDNGGNVAKRITKIRESENTNIILDAGWKIEVHGWKKVKNRWQVRIVEITPIEEG